MTEPTRPRRSRPAVRAALWVPVLLYMALIFGLSSMSKPPGPAGINDKLKHFVAYAGLALVTLNATSGGTLPSVTGVAALTAWSVATVYGATDEFHQSFVPGRTPDILDLYADAVGAGVGVGAAWAFGIIARSRRRAASS